MFVPYAPSNIDRVIRGAQAIGGLANAGYNIGRALFRGRGGSRGARPIRRAVVYRKRGYGRRGGPVENGRDTHQLQARDKDFGHPITLYFHSVAAGKVVLLNGTIEGSGFNQRTGRKVNMLTLQLDAFIYANTAGGTSAVGITTPRVALVYDRQANGSTPVWNDVFADQDYANGVTNGTEAHVNMNNRERFVIIRYWHHLLPAVGVAGANAASQVGVALCEPQEDGRYSLHFNEYINLRGLQTIYGSSTSPPVFGDIKSGSLFLIARSQDTQVTANLSSWFLLGSCRLRFSD